MNKPVKLSEIIESMDFQFDETNSFLNTKTGQVVSVDDDDFREVISVFLMVFSP